MSLTLFTGFYGGCAHASADDAYQVKGVMVDETGTSALEARKKAFAVARRKAYEAVADKIVPEKDRPNLVVPDDRVIASLVHDFEIVSEKMTTRRYAGTIDVRFTPAAVKRTIQVAPGGVAPDQALLASGDVATDTIVTGVDAQTMPSRHTNDYIYSPRKIPAAVQTQNKPILILPWYGPTGRQTLWGQGNPWRAAWEENEALARDKTMPMVLPVGDVMDVRDYSPPQALSRRGDIDALLKRYDASQAILAMAEPAQNGGVIVSLYRFENASPLPLGRFAVDASARDVMAEAVTQAAASLRAMPLPNTPAPTQVSMPPQAQTMAMPASGSYRTLARFSGLQEWVAMRQALVRVPGVSSVSIRAISPSQANIEFSYAGDPNVLMASLSQANLKLAPLPPGSVGAPAPGADTPQYLLSVGRVY